MALTVEQIAANYRVLKDRYNQRDARWSDLNEIRKGNLNSVFPGLFSNDYPKPMVANFIDVVARDVSEVIAPLPAFNCSSTNSVSDRARQRADKRTMIAAGYRDQSNLQTAMYTGADRYVTFGLLPFIVEPDYDRSMPIIRLDNPMNAYPEFDRFGRLRSYTKRYLKPVWELCNDFPEFEGQILGQWEKRDSKKMLEMVRYEDDEQTLLFLPERKNLVLMRIENPTGTLNVVCAVRPGIDADQEQRGQFDDVMWVQVARSRFAALALEAATKSVEAPFALPADVNVMEIGPDAVIRSANPEKIRRVSLDIPSGIFAESASLDQEMRVGARYPEGRSGNVEASIVTGRGVQALMGGFDTQIKTAQAILAEALQEVMRLCFNMDETLWPNKEKTVRGTNAGAPYEITYVPKKDIAGEHWVDVSYGLMAGLDPNRALVFGLQARGDKLISRDFLRRQMPWEMNVSQEEEKIDVETLRDSLVQAIAGYAQSLPALVQSGMDPVKPIVTLAKIVEGRQKGTPIEKVVEEAFEPEEVPAPEEMTPEEMMMGGAQPGEASGAMGGEGLQPTGRMTGVAPGQQGMAPGGRPSLQMLLAGLSSSGAPQLSASVSRRTAI